MRLYVGKINNCSRKSLSVRSGSRNINKWFLAPACIVSLSSAVFLTSDLFAPKKDALTLGLLTDKFALDSKRAIKLDAPELIPASIEKVVSYEVKKGEGVDTIFKRIGAVEEDRKKVLSSLSVMDSLSLIGKLKIGSKIEVLKEKTGELLSLKFHNQDKSTVSLSKTLLGNFSSTVVHPSGEKMSQQVFSDTVHTTFSEAALGTGMPKEVVDDFVDLFSDKINFQKDLSEGDSFAVVIENKNKNINKTEKQSKQIVAASLTVDGESIYSIRFIDSNNKVHYVDEKGSNGTDQAPLRYPLQFTRITSVFSNSRFHPVLRNSRPHNGIDFAAPYGTAVRSVGNGTVVESAYHHENGNYVRIRHNDRFTTEYLHLSKIASGIKKGSIISQGQVIGAVGASGLATGPHLHFGMFDNGHYVDPMNGKFMFAVTGKDKVPATYIQAAVTLLKDAQTEATQLAFLRKSSQDSIG